jgi:hypothetical protein
VRDNFFVLGLCRFGQELKYLCVPIGIVICDLLVHKPVDDAQIASGEGLSGRKETFILWRRNLNSLLRQGVSPMDNDAILCYSEILF